MKKYLFNFINLCCSLFTFIVVCRYYYAIAVFADENNCSPAQILGGELSVILFWVILFVLAMGCIASVAGIVNGVLNNEDK